MTSDQQAALLALTPQAVQWVQSCCSEVLESGAPLTEQDSAIARKVGVVFPEKIRVLHVDTLPLPTDASLRNAALAAGLFGPGMVGLTVGHGIYLCRGHTTLGLLSHEYRHVHQYEVAGSIAAFIPKYLQQVVTFGYRDAPYEIDARAHELDTYS